MGYTFARAGAVIQMKVEDYYIQKRRGWVRLHEIEPATLSTRHVKWEPPVAIPVWAWYALLRAEFSTYQVVGGPKR